MENRRWEILLKEDDLNGFGDFMDEFGSGGFSAQRMSDYFWIICYPPEEAKVLAMLRFNIAQISSFGTEILFTDCPSSGDIVDL